MNLLIDLGNTRLKWAPLDAAGQAGAMQALAHAEPGFLERFGQQLTGLNAQSRVWLASVASPALTRSVRALVEAGGSRVYPVVVQPEWAGVRVAYAQPGRLGVDRFLGLLAAHARQAGPQLLVSVGSAITLDLLDGAGLHRGGLIAPTPEHQQQALAARFPALTGHAGRAVAFADDTADAIASGCLAGSVGLVETSLVRAEEWLGTRPRLLLTGGGAPALAAALSTAGEVVPELLMHGLAVYARADGAGIA